MGTDFTRFGWALILLDFDEHRFYEIWMGTDFTRFVWALILLDSDGH